jgi:hypothetical protein
LISPKLLKGRGIDLPPIDADDYYRDETPTTILIRQILSAAA